MLKGVLQGKCKDTKQELKSKSIGKEHRKGKYMVNYKSIFVTFIYNSTFLFLHNLRLIIKNLLAYVFGHTIPICKIFIKN